MKEKELSQILHQNIESNNYPNHKLPTEDQLIEQYQVTRYCVRQAIQMLVSKGLIFQIQGSGMYIRENIQLNIGFADKIIKARKLNQTEADWLKLTVGDPAIIFNEAAYLKNGQLFNASTLIYNYQEASFFDFSTFKK